MTSRLSHPTAALALTLLLAAGAAACSHLTSHAAAAQPAKETRQVVRLDSTVLNLADPGANTYVRLGVSVALGPLPALSDEGNSALVSSAARDTIVAVVTSKNSAEILTPEGKAALKQAIQADLQRRLPNFKVEEIFFDEFLIQH